MFVELQKVPNSFVVSVRQFIHPHWTTQPPPLDGFSCNLIFEYFQKSGEKVEVSLKSDKNNRYFTWRPVYFCDRTLLISS